MLDASPAHGEPHTHDVIVVGGGLTGLVGAWHLRDLDVLLLEADQRAGGRIRSERRGDHWVNLGAHLVSRGQLIHGLATELDVPLVVPSGLRGTTVAWGSRLVHASRAEELPFRLPLSLRDRVSLSRVGLRLKLAHRRAVRADDCGLLGGHVEPPSMGADPDLGSRSFATLLGSTGRDVHDLLRIAANRAAAEPDQVSAHYVSLSPISAGEAPRFNVVGGTEELIRALQRKLGNKVRTGVRATRVSQTGAGVEVEVAGRDGPELHRARACLVTLPAPIVREVVAGLPAAKDAALAAIPYGSYVVAGFFTREDTPFLWSDRYMVVAPNRAFCLLFNSANASRPAGTATGGGFIVYAGGGRAHDLLPRSDADIAGAFISDLEPLAPDIRRSISDVVIQRWPLGNSITTMGRSLDQAAIAADVERLYFAGDYIGHPGMDSAAATAIHAASQIRERLTREEVRPAA